MVDVRPPKFLRDLGVNGTPASAGGITTPQVQQTQHVQNQPPSKTADVLDLGGVSHVQWSGGPVGETTKTARAQHVLKRLAAKDGARAAFGGRVTIGGVDKAATIASYYALSFDAARYLATNNPESHDGIQKFLRSVSVPESAKGVIGEAAKLVDAVTAEAAHPLGKEDPIDWNAVELARGNGRADMLALSDAAVDQICFPSGNGGYNRSLDWFPSNTPPSARVAMLRLYARGLERGVQSIGFDRRTGKDKPVNITPLTAKDISGLGAHLPVDGKSAAVLARLAIAAGVSPIEVLFHGMPLPTFRQSPPVVEAEGPTPSARQPLGRETFTDGEKFFEALKSGDWRATRVDDDTIRMAWRFAFRDKAQEKILSFRSASSPTFQAAAVHVMARAAELGLPMPALPSWIADRAPATPAGLAAMRRMYRAYGWPEYSAPSMGSLRMARSEGVGPSLPTPKRRYLPDGGPLGDTTIPGSKPLDINRADPRAFTLSDASLANFGDASFRDYMASYADPRIYSLFARALELAWAGKCQAAKQTASDVAPNLQFSILQHLSEPVSERLSTDAAIPHLARLVEALRVDPAMVRVQRDGHVVPLSSLPSWQRTPTAEAARARAAKLESSLAALDPKAGLRSDVRLEALTTLLGSDRGGALEVHEILPRLVDGRLDGTVSQVDLRSSSKDEQVAAVRQVMRSFADPQQGDLAAALLLRCEPGLMAETLHSATAEKVSQLSGRELDYVLADVRQDRIASYAGSFELRVALLEATTPQAVDEALKLARQSLGDPTVARALLERARLAGPATSEAAALLDRLGPPLDPEATRAAVPGDMLATVRERLMQRLQPLLAEYVRAETTEAKAEAMPRLVEAMQTARFVMTPAAVVELVLGKLYAYDLVEALPLGDVEKRLGRVEADAPPTSAPTGKTVTIEGKSGPVLLPLSTAKNPERAAIPSMEHADLVMTDTTRQVAEDVALRWGPCVPTLLDGPPSASKTSIVRYFCYKTGSVFRHISMSAGTTVEDLIGRFVSGKVEYDRPRLLALSEGDLARIAEKFGVTTQVAATLKGGLFRADKAVQEPRSRADIIKDIVAAQEDVHWEDGPLLQALKRGETVLLDEIDLATPGVLARINELLDGGKGITVTEHLGEVVEKHAEFRIFATQNGRLPLSVEQLDRWKPINVPALTKEDISTILDVKYGKQLPAELRAQLVATQEVLAREADKGVLESREGGLAFTLRNVMKVAERFIAFRGKATYADGKPLSDAALLRRETEEVYVNGLSESVSREHALRCMTATMDYKGPSFYAGLKVEKRDGGWQVGDLFVKSLGIADERVPGASYELVLTDKTKRELYEMCKALHMHENYLLVGEKGGGKTALAYMYALMRQQPFYRQPMTTETEADAVIGGYREDGQWHDGLLLRAGRPPPDNKKPGVVLLDEVGYTPAEISERLNSLLGNERYLVLTEKGGGTDIVPFHPDAAILAATNPVDPRYPDRTPLSRAARSRYTVRHIEEITDPTDLKTIAGMLGARAGVSEAVSSALVDLHLWANATFKNQQSRMGLSDDRPTEFSLRDLLEALDVTIHWNKSEAADTAFLRGVQAIYGARPRGKADREAILTRAKLLAAA